MGNPAAMRKFHLLFILLCCAASASAAPNEPSDEPQNDSQPPVTFDAREVIRWKFDTPKADASEPGVWKGKKQEVDGPRSPLFPAFATSNQAAKFVDGRVSCLPTTWRSGRCGSIKARASRSKHG